MVLINGIQLNLEQRGEGPPLIMLHSGLADSRLWTPILDDLAAHFTVITYDLPGFGKSEQHPYNFSHLDDLLSVMTYLGIERTHLLGISLGGMIVLDFAAQYPERVDKLVLPAASMRGYAFPNAFKWIEDYMAALQGGPETSTDFWLQQPMFDTLTDKPEARTLTRRMIRENYTAWSPIANKPEVTWPTDAPVEHLNNFDMDTLVMIGANDLPDLVSCANLLSANIPNVRQITYPNVGHHFVLEIPDQFSRDLIAFLQE